MKDDRTRPGAHLHADGAEFLVPAPDAAALWLCLYRTDDRETDRIAMERDTGGWWSVHVAGITAGQKYGYRADGPYEPGAGHRFDPAKLLADPWATQIDRPYRYHSDLAAPRGAQVDSAPLMPKCMLETPQPLTPSDLPQACFSPGGLIYELNVRGFSMLHPDVPEPDRGTLRALAHPAVIEHLTRIGASAVELMPVTAWIDEAHLARLGLSNAWGYNPVTFMALDPRLAPAGISDLRHVSAALRAAGISVFLDLVFNHTGEGDASGPTLSLRGLMNARAFHHTADGLLINHTGTGNTVACNEPIIAGMIIDALRHFVLAGGVDGFRFDLAPILGRGEAGFDPDAPLLNAMRNDPVIASRVLIAEPWDIGPEGYQLGNFLPPLLEWNDRYRDDVRRFWRGDKHTRGSLATRLAGSSDVFQKDGQARTRSVNFLAAHDGFTLADTVSYENKHNAANGENNRDGHEHNFSWNNGVEGATDDAGIQAARQRDIKALLTTLFVSRGTIMLTAGDEFGRTQQGNNNAYAQDNDITWVDWQRRDMGIEAHVAMLAELRRRFPDLNATAFLTGQASDGDVLADVEWRDVDGDLLTAEHWSEAAADQLKKLLQTGVSSAPHVAFLFNRSQLDVRFALPAIADFAWTGANVTGGHVDVPGRSVGIVFLERQPESAWPAISDNKENGNV